LLSNPLDRTKAASGRRTPNRADFLGVFSKIMVGFTSFTPQSPMSY
jgi:hypothetical protein